MKEGDSGGMKTISIITVTFNAADTIKRTLDSIAAQTCRDFEHVIIDGGSTDGTMEAVNAYKDGNPGIQVVAVSESDKGLYDAMNKGLKRATGVRPTSSMPMDDSCATDVCRRPKNSLGSPSGKECWCAISLSMP